jgi:hypothetical protein
MLIPRKSPDILFLSETKSSPSQVSSILHSLHFYLLCQVAPVGSSCGLVLSWRPGIDLECFISNKNHIAAWCFSYPVHSPWILSCIYGPLTLEKNLHFGTPLLLLVIILLAFGCAFVFDQSEKRGGRLVASSSFCPFKKLIGLFGLVDLGFAGNLYTWCNKR